MIDMQYSNVESGSVYAFENFFELSPDLLCIAGFDGFFKRINPAVSSLLGYTNEELLSRPINDFVYEDDKDITNKVRRELIKGSPLFHFENRYVTKSGEIVWLSWTSMNVDSEQLVYAVAKNITHKRRLEEERNALVVNLTKINNELKKITYTTSHDLRAPVNNLLSVFNLLDPSKINDDETATFINILRSAGESLKETLNDYVDILSQQEGIQEQVEMVNLNQSLNEVLDSIQSLIKDSKASVLVDFSKVPFIKFNKAYLRSVFLNLITNSIKYARPGCLPVISISSTNIKGVDQLIIADNCLGFDMDKVKDKIFGLHQKFHDHSDSKGIGLYLVHNHVTSMGGQIAIESKLNEGTTFVITLKR